MCCMSSSASSASHTSIKDYRAQALGIAERIRAHGPRPKGSGCRLWKR